jgi:hypothetical protein
VLREGSLTPRADEAEDTGNFRSELKNGKDGFVTLTSKGYRTLRRFVKGAPCDKNSRHSDANGAAPKNNPVFRPQTSTNVIIFNP